MANHIWGWGNEYLHFLPEKALWREKDRVLMVADLHLGKAEVFQANGVPMPSDGDSGTLNPLLDLCHSCLLYTSPSPRDATLSRMPSSA